MPNVELATLPKLLAAAFALVVVIFIYVRLVQRSARWKRHWRRLAGEWQAQLETSGHIWPAMVMRCWYRGVPVLVSWDSGRGEFARYTPYLKVSAAYPWQGPRYRLEVGSLGAGRRKGIQLGGVPEFDRLFVVKAEDPSLVAGLLTPHHQQQILQVVGTPAAGDIESDGRQLLLRKVAKPTRSELAHSIPLLVSLVLADVGQATSSQGADHGQYAANQARLPRCIVVEEKR